MLLITKSEGYIHSGLSGDSAVHFSLASIGLLTALVKKTG